MLLVRPADGVEWKPVDQSNKPMRAFHTHSPYLRLIRTETRGEHERSRTSTKGYMKSHKPRQFLLILWNIIFFQNKLVLLYYWGIFISDLHKMFACVWWRPLAQTVQKKWCIYETLNFKQVAGSVPRPFCVEFACSSDDSVGSVGSTALARPPN